jgi:hypothetical protein
MSLFAENISLSSARWILDRLDSPLPACPCLLRYSQQGLDVEQQHQQPAKQVPNRTT